MLTAKDPAPVQDQTHVISHYTNPTNLHVKGAVKMLPLLNQAQNLTPLLFTRGESSTQRTPNLQDKLVKAKLPTENRGYTAQISGTKSQITVLNCPYY